VLVASAGALDVNLFQYLFGSILTVTRGDLAVIAALGAIVLGTVWLLYRPLAAVAIDEEGARVAGVPALLGLAVSHYADLPPGGTIVLVAAGAFAVCSLVAIARGG
jgi:ABC-type Mn2+/Zn2+ transport system permease subunit